MGSAYRLSGPKHSVVNMAVLPIGYNTVLRVALDTDTSTKKKRHKMRQGQ